jgi:hydrogenase-4 membrane subunit HyfE
MILIGEKARDFLMVFAALLWAFIVYASWQGALSKSNQLIYLGLLACATLVVVYYLMGAVVDQKISTAVLIWPVLLNGATQAVAFTIVYMTKGEKLDFILGMHPGFFGAMIFFWLGNFLTSTLSYWVLFKKYAVPDEEWSTFMKEVAAQEKLH